MREGATIRTPTVLQLQDLECSLAALAMVLAWHGCHVPLDDLRQSAGVGVDGTSMAVLKRLAADHGFVARGFRKDPDTLADVPLPCLVFLNFNHVVVVEAVRADGVQVNDPVCGPHLIPAATFDRAFTGVVLTIEPGPQARRIPAPPRHMVWRALAGVVPDLTLALGLAGATTALLAWAALALSDSGSLGASAWAAVALVPLVAVLHAAVQEVLRRRLTRRLDRRIRSAVTGREGLFLALRTPATLNRILASPTTAAGATVAGLAGAAVDAVASLIPLWLLAGLFPPAAAAALVACGLAGALSVIVPLRRDSLLRQAMLHEQTARGLDAEVLRGVHAVQFGGRDDEALTVATGAQALATEPMQRLTASRATVAAVTTAAALAAAATAAVAPAEVRPSVVALVALAVLPWLRLADMPRWVLALRTVAMLWEDIEAAAAPPRPISGMAPPGAVVAVDVTFGFGRARPPFLDGLCLDIPPAARIGLTGAPGAGTTALLALIAGDLAPWTGAVRAGGRVALVADPPVLFDATVADNIALWRTDIDDAAVKEALRMAGLWEELAARGGAAAPVGIDGAALSGGQRRRLALARALASRPDILLIDGGLDAVDLAAEEVILRGLRQQGITVVLVSRRHATLSACDAAWSLSNGRLHPWQGEAEIAAKTVPAADPLALPPPLSGSEDGLEALVARLAAAIGAGPGVADTAPPPRLTPLAWAARRQGVFLRPVLLEPADWWRAGDLPLLARHTERGWLVLLPGRGGGYRWQAGDGRQGRVDRALAAGMARDAFAAYARTEPPPASVGAVTLGAAVLPWLAFGVFGLAVVAGQWSVAVAAGALAAGGRWLAERALGRRTAVIGLRGTAHHWHRLVHLSAGWLRRQDDVDLMDWTAAPRRLGAAISARATCVAAGTGALLVAGVGVLSEMTPGMAASLWAGAVAIGAARGWLWHVVEERRRADVAAAGRFLWTVARALRWLPQDASPALFARADALRACATRGSGLAAVALRWHPVNDGLVPLVAVMLAAQAGGDGSAMAVAAVLAVAGTMAGGALAEMIALNRRNRALSALDEAPSDAEGATPAASAPLVLHAVTFGYEPGAPPVVAGAGLSIAPGEVVALMGPSGAGKSTLLRLLLGLERPQAGIVTWGGVPLQEVDRSLLRAGWAAALQDDPLPRRAVRRLMGGAAPCSDAVVWRLLRLCGVADLIAAKPLGLAHIADAASLSVSAVHRLQAARALSLRARLLVIDETLSAFDEDEARAVLDTVRADAATCVYTTHRPEIAALADRVVTLAGGQLVERPQITAPLVPLARSHGSAAPPQPPGPPPRLYRPRALAQIDRPEQLETLPRLVTVYPAVVAGGLVAVSLLLLWL